MSNMSNETALATATLMDLLFEHVLSDDGTAFSEAELSRQAGISPSGISALRRGINKNPRLNHVRAISHFFRVPLTYWSATTEDEAVAIIRSALRGGTDPNPSLAMRLTHLSDEARGDIERILNWVQRADKGSLPIAESEAED